MIEYGKLPGEGLGNCSLWRWETLSNGWLVLLLFGVVCIAVFGSNKKAMWSWIVLVVGIILLFYALSMAVYDPFAWLVAIIALAVMAYRAYDRHNRSNRSSN